MNRVATLTSRYLGLALTSLTLLACGGAATQSSEPAAPSEGLAPATTSAPSAVDASSPTTISTNAASNGEANDQPVTTPNVTPETVEPAVAKPTPLMHLVLKGGENKMQRAHHGAPFFIEGWGNNRHVVARTSPNGEFIRDRRLIAGMGHMSITGIYGGLEAGAIAIGVDHRSRVGWSATFVRTALGWKETHHEGMGVHYAGVQPWVGGRYIAYLTRNIPMGGDQAGSRIKIISGPKGGVVLPKPKMRPKGKGNPWGPSPAVNPVAFAAFPSGHVVVVGKESYEHFAPGAARGTIGPLPAPGIYNAQFAKHGENELLVTLKDGPAHFDGKRWHLWPLPNGDSARMMDHHDGRWWAISSKHLYKREGDAWIAVPIAPEPTNGTRHIQDMASIGGALWLTSSTKPDAGKMGPRQLWSSVKPPRGMQALEDLSKTDRGVGVRAMAIPPTARPDCAQVFAVFFGLAKTVDAKHDFPLTRRALKGHREFSSARFVKTEENGRKYFGAFVKDYASGRKLTALLASKVKNATPKLLCHKPKVLAELEFDLATGKSSGWAPYRD